jgi:hypothetical protein
MKRPLNRRLRPPPMVLVSEHCVDIAWVMPVVRFLKEEAKAPGRELALIPRDETSIESRLSIPPASCHRARCAAVGDGRRSGK